MTDYLLVPTSALLPVELRAEFGDLPSALVPFNGRPALAHILSAYPATEWTRVVAGHEGFDLLAEVVDRISADGPVTLVRTGSVDSLGGSVLAALESLPLEAEDRLVVNFGDTLCEALPPQDITLVATQRDTYRWTTLAVDEQGKISFVEEKDSDKTSDACCVGAFGFASAAEFRRWLHKHVDGRAGEQVSVDPFYTALTDYYNAAGGQVVREAQEWSDLGHLDSYYEARRSFISKRFFNFVDVDDKRGVLRKSSTAAAKFRDEVRWYEQLPKRLRHLAPRVLDSDLELERPWAELEYYGYPSLSEAYVHGCWDVGAWSRVLTSLGSVLDQMSAHVAPNCAPSLRRAACTEMYVDKTVARLRDALSVPALAGLLEPVRVNGVETPGLAGALAAVPYAVERLGLLTDPTFAVLHGDFCLSNLLFDRRTSVVRVIDPRGSFGLSGLYGDPRYDLAKLAHSFSGDYDFLVGGLFDLEHDEDGVHLAARLRPGHQRVSRLFDDWLAERVGPGQPLAQVRLIVALLFLSMLPLHADHPFVQQALAARGLELFAASS